MSMAGHRGRPVRGRSRKLGTDVSGTSDAYVVEVDLPGVKRNDVTVDLIADGVLTVRGPKTEPEKPRRIAITGK